jgi:hypothetical protein
VSATHLVGRFFGSLWPFAPKQVDDDWAADHLLDTEVELWRRMPRADQRHAIGVARRTVALLDNDIERPVMAAALLHDVGKIDSGLGTYLRVMATLSAKIAGRETAELWVKSTGLTRRIGLYLVHPKIGADLLGMAGSDAFTIAWTREHHLDEESWTVPKHLGSVLREADGD